MTEKNIIELIKQSSVDNRITCAGAFAISQKESVFPDLLGVAINEAGVKICECQIGLFGCGSGTKTVTPAERVSEKTEDMIFSCLDDGKLSCQDAWEIAAELKVRKIDVASACEKLKIKINRCQIGAF